MVRSRGLKKIVFLILKNEAGGEDRINRGWPGSAPPPHCSKTGLAFSSWGVCVPMCMPVCVQNTDGRRGLPLGSEVTSGKPQSAHPGVERTASGVLSRAHPGLIPPTGHGYPIFALITLPEPSQPPGRVGE